MKSIISSKKTSKLIIFCTKINTRLILSAEKKKAETKRSLANAGKSRCLILIKMTTLFLIIMSFIFTKISPE